MPPRRVGAEERLARVHRLGRHDAPGAAAELAAFLADASQHVREAAARSLGRLGEAALGQAEALAACYDWSDAAGPERDPGCRVRCAALESLGQMGYRPAAEQARRAIRTYQPERVGFGLEDTAVRLRAIAAGVLAQLGAPDAPLDLGVLLFDTTTVVPVAESEARFATMPARVAAARALGATADAAALIPLAIRLAHPAGEAAEVLVECMDAVAALGSPRAVEILHPFLRHTDPYLTAGAATALARAAGAAALPLLAESLPSAPREAQEPMALAIASIRSDETVGTLIGLAEHPEPGVRAAAARGLLMVASPEALGALRRLSRDPDPQVRRAAE